VSETVPNVSFTIEFKGGYWRWFCHEHGYGDHFLTRPRTLESVDTHLRTKHPLVTRRDRAIAGQR
jgi:hypothetical protein